MKPDIFDEIEQYVPEDHRPAYWRMVAHFRQLKPDDEILHIILAMGILTFILRELPAGLLKERSAWQDQFNAFRQEADKIMAGSNRQMVTVSNQLEAVNKALEKSGNQMRENAAYFEVISRDAVGRLDAEGMAKRLTARVEERILVPFEALVARIEKSLQLLEKIGEEILRLISHLRKFIWDG